MLFFSSSVLYICFLEAYFFSLHLIFIDYLQTCGHILPKWWKLANLCSSGIGEVLILWYVLVTVKLELTILVLTLICFKYYSMLFFGLDKHNCLFCWRSIRNPTEQLFFSAYWTALSWLFNKSGCYLLLSDWK